MSEVCQSTALRAECSSATRRHTLFNLGAKRFKRCRPDAVEAYCAESYNDAAQQLTPEEEPILRRQRRVCMPLLLIP